MPPTRRAAPTIGPVAALLLMPVSFALLALAGAMALGWGLAGLIATQLLGFALPAWFAARRCGRAPAVLGLIRPPRRALVGGLLVAASFWYLSASLLVPLVEDWVTDREAELLAEHVAGPESIVFKLFALALVPAVCEELLFRGAIARGLRGRIGLVGAALLSAAYFALLHGSLARLPITFALGIVLAVATLRCGSLVPAICIHACNNAAAVLLTWPPVGVRAGFLDEGAPVILPLAALASAVGLVLLWRAGNEQIPYVSDATSL